MAVPQAEAHVWYASTETCRPAVAASYRALLSDAERAHLDHLPFEERRREYLVTRALVRTVLSLYEPVPPAVWQFQADAYGRPTVAKPLTRLPLNFNLSHTRGLVLCLVAFGRSVGVDAEHLDRSIDVMEIAAHAFASVEVADLAATPVEWRRGRFFQYWTLKESYVKARGQGISIPLNRFAFCWGDNGRPHIRFAPLIEDDGSRWSFHCFAPTPKHIAAATVERRFPGEAIRIVLRPMALPLL